MEECRFQIIVFLRSIRDLSGTKYKVTNNMQPQLKITNQLMQLMQGSNSK
jgi:hypothetical protein